MAEFPLLPIPTPVPDQPQAGSRGRNRDCIRGVPDQLEDGKPGRADELVPEKLKNASSRPALHAQRHVAGLHTVFDMLQTHARGCTSSTRSPSGPK